MRVLLAFILLLSLAGCATTSATSMSHDTVKVDVSTTPSCAKQTNEVMMHRAGIETIRRGYDKYIILNHGTGSVATGIGQYGQINRSGTGSVIIKMFKEGDPAGSKALAARDLLGPEWQKIVSEKVSTSCL